jgi:excisionase family DNA binding protein
MNIFKFFKSLIISKKCNLETQDIDSLAIKEVSKIAPPKLTESKEYTEPMLTMGQAAKINGVTRQAIFFAIKMKRLNAKRENDTWLISESDLKEYNDKKYCRSKSRNDGELIFDKSKGFFSIGEAAKMLNRNTNHIYYLVRMGRLRTHRQGTAIVIKDTELYNHIEFLRNKKKNLKTG